MTTKEPSISNKIKAAFGIKPSTKGSVPKSSELTRMNERLERRLKSEKYSSEEKLEMYSKAREEMRQVRELVNHLNSELENFNGFSQRIKSKSSERLKNAKRLQSSTKMINAAKSEQEVAKIICSKSLAKDAEKLHSEGLRLRRSKLRRSSRK